MPQPNRQQHCPLFLYHQVKRHGKHTRGKHVANTWQTRGKHVANSWLTCKLMCSTQICRCSMLSGFRILAKTFVSFGKKVYCRCAVVIPLNYVFQFWLMAIKLPTNINTFKLWIFLLFWHHRKNVPRLEISFKLYQVFDPSTWQLPMYVHTYVHT
jgi:hypothetical protein